MYHNCFVDQVFFDAAMYAGLYGEPDVSTWNGDSTEVDEVILFGLCGDPDESLWTDVCDDVDEVICNRFSGSERPQCSGDCNEFDEVIHAELYGEPDESSCSYDDEDPYDDCEDLDDENEEYPWYEERHDACEDDMEDRYYGTYAHDVAGYSDDDIDTIFDGDPDAYWNID